MDAIFILLLVLQVLVPFMIVKGLCRQLFDTPRDWLLALLPRAAYVLTLVLVMPWGHVPYALRLFWPLLLTVEAARAWVRMRRAATRPPEFPAAAEDRSGPDGIAQPRPLLRRLLWPALLTLALGRPSLDALRARRVPEPAVDLVFPLRQGTYVVGHGGSHVTVNYHNAHETQRYALDISALNAWGMRAAGVGPSALERYAIFGHVLYSPCDATVRSVVDGLPDHTPPHGDGENPAGNHVELEAQGIRIFLAHMRRGSVRVRKGDRIRQGDPLGAVGNSGNTTEPHLHIHAVRGGQSLYDGVGVPLTFGGRFLVRNDLVQAP